MIDGIKKPTKARQLTRRKVVPKRPSSPFNTERTKLWLAVSSLTIIIFIGWIFSLKYTSKRQNKEEKLSNLKNIQEDLSQAFLELKEQMDKLKRTNLPISPTLTNQQIEEMTKKLKQTTNNKQQTTANIIPDLENWLTYRNEEYGFEVKFPDFFEAGKPERFISQNVPIAHFANQKTNRVDVAIFKDGFKNYKLIDNPGGAIFNYDLNRQEWLFNNSHVISSGPKRIDSEIEAYVYSSGDILCRWDWIIVPHTSYSFVVEIINTACAKFDESINDYIDPGFKLESEDILSTFKFID